MKNYSIYTTSKLFVVSADGYKLVREKGGYCRFVFIKDNAAVATFTASFVNAIVEMKGV